MRTPRSGAAKRELETRVLQTAQVKLRITMLKRSAIATLVTTLALFPVFGASAATVATHKTHAKSHKITESATAQKQMASMRHSSKTVAARNRSSHLVYTKHHYYERFHASSFADNQGEGDITAGEDPIVRAAAME